MLWVGALDSQKEWGTEDVQVVEIGLFINMSRVLWGLLETRNE